MTTPNSHLCLTTVDAEDTVRIKIEGDLDYDTADLLLQAVTAQLAERPELAHLHLHFAGLGSIDSMGLSVLLMIGRRTTAAHVRLHLDDRPANLDRLLDITGTGDYLTGAPVVGAVTTEGAAARSTTPDNGG
ncbi:STAS domain-containing protein [Streptomyces sp. NPDC047123]|uniref:STAS domain-containing protein n=1 Tax=unclassified Streptomyces TaxID=2593676 RepID=UPI0034103829